MLDPEERFYQWQEYCKRAEDFMKSVEGDLQIYTPTKYGSIPDKDTPFAEELFTRLESLCEFMQEHLHKLDIEYAAFDNERMNLACNFEAWDTGLCPKLMRKVSCISYSDIAKYKKQRGISYQDTQQAILQWQEKEEKYNLTR